MKELVVELQLFVGGAVQWGLTSAFARIANAGGDAALFLTVFAGQTIWWVNIHQATRDRSLRRWFIWCLGTAIGAVIGKWLS